VLVPLVLDSVIFSPEIISSVLWVLVGLCVLGALTFLSNLHPEIVLYVTVPALVFSLFLALCVHKATGGITWFPYVFILLPIAAILIAYVQFRDPLPVPLHNNYW